jgi:hypothetical protein
MAEQSDIAQIIPLARAAHDESRFSYIPFSEDKVQKIVLTALEDRSRHGMMLAVKGQVLIGMAYCSVGELHIGTGVLLTTIHNINVQRSIRSSLSGGRAALGLFKGIETWSQARGAQEVLFHVTSGVDLARAHKLVKRVGYEFIGGSYAKTLNPNKVH